MKSQKEIYEQIDIANETKWNSKFKGMTYEDGVIAALEWIIGQRGDDEKPMDE